MKISFLSGTQRGSSVPVTMSPISIGRDASNTLVLQDPKVSRQHAQIFFAEDGRWYLKVVSPENPVYSSQERYNQLLQLQPGMIVQLGDTHLQFDLTPDPGQSLAALNAPSGLATPSPQPSPLVPLLLGGGSALLILTLVLLGFNRGDSASALASNLPAQLTLLAQASVTATRTVTATTVPSATASPTATASATPRATPTLVPVVPERAGAVETELYSETILAPSLLDEQQVPVEERDIIARIRFNITNNTAAAFATTDIGVGAFVRNAAGGWDEKVPFVLPNQADATIEPAETQVMEWLVVLDEGARIGALAVTYQGTVIMQEFLD